MVAPADAAWWPYVPFAYAFMAAVAPWLTGCFLEAEFRIGYSVLLGILGALPFGIAARWLADSPYRAIVVGCWIVVALWALHLLLSLGSLLIGLRKGRG